MCKLSVLILKCLEKRLRTIGALLLKLRTLMEDSSARQSRAAVGLIGVCAWRREREVAEPATVDNETLCLDKTGLAEGRPGGDARGLL
jgi:hypothetical protein